MVSEDYIIDNEIEKGLVIDYKIIQPMVTHKLLSFHTYLHFNQQIYKIRKKFEFTYKFSNSCIKLLRKHKCQKGITKLNTHS